MRRPRATIVIVQTPEEQRRELRRAFWQRLVGSAALTAAVLAPSPLNLFFQ